MKAAARSLVLIYVFLFIQLAVADCGDMEVMDHSGGMCLPLAMAGMPMRMLMLHGNAFLNQTVEQGPRGRNAVTIPDMFMADLGSSFGDHHYVNLDFMGTVERWTYPEEGYPELLQIGEAHPSGQPFLDFQHPHSSPVMGLTLSDTIRLSERKDFLKIFFAPRGESTDGPVAFMHRPTGMVNPDAPLGHHIGQDVGHISSTVLGAAVRIGTTTIEASTFNGTEPEPTKIDLPMGPLNSYAARLTQEFGAQTFAMISAAYVKSPEPSEPLLKSLWRYSASVYGEHRFTGGFANGWGVHKAFIYGLINNYDNTSALMSFAHEFWFHKESKNIWGRIECLQRTPAELEIGSSLPNERHWVTAVTLGYTHKLISWDNADLGLGGSVTEDFLPPLYQGPYGGNPFTGKIFLQLGGMKMWEI